MNEDLARSIQAMLRDEGIRVILRVYEGQVYLHYRGPTGWWMTSFLYDPIMPQPTLVNDIVDEARKMSRKFTTEHKIDLAIQLMLYGKPFEHSCGDLPKSNDEADIHAEY